MLFKLVLLLLLCFNLSSKVFLADNQNVENLVSFKRFINVLSHKLLMSFTFSESVEPLNLKEQLISDTK